MSAAEILVVLGGLAAIVWVNWWFFIAGERTAPGNRARRDAESGGASEARGA